MRGTGRNPMAILSVAEPAPLGFGSLVVGNSHVKTLSVTNVGEAPATGLREATGSLVEPYSVESHTCGDGLEPRQACTYTVKFAPTSTGTFSGRLKLEFFDQGVLKSVTRILSGSATSPEHRVFLTSVSYDGNLGGVAGANAKCQLRAEAAGRTGRWRAILNGPGSIQVNGPVLDFKGNRIAGNA